MTPPKKRLKREVPFLEAHEKMYGVRVVERDLASQKVQSVLCMFCAAFGREDDPRGSSRRRARTKKLKYWGGPTFRTDNYTAHLTMQHPSRWREYQEMSSEQKLSYFNAVQALPKANGKTRKSQGNEQATSEQNSVYLQPSEGQESTEDEAPLSVPASPELETTECASDADVPVAVESIPLVPVATMESPVVGAVSPASEAPVEAQIDGKVLTFLLDRDVVDVALGDVLFRAEDADKGAGNELVAFESTLDEWDSEDQQKSDGTAEVRAVVRSAELFHRVVELLAADLSFDQTAAIVQAQTTTGIRGNRFVTRLARVAVGANLQDLGRVMQRSWAFSLSLHSVDRRQRGEKDPRVFIDVRVRVFCSGKMEIFHLLTLPVEDGGDPGTTGEIMFETMSTFLQSIHKRWQQKVIGCSSEIMQQGTDSTSNGVASAVARSITRRVEQQALPGFVHVPSARPALDALMQWFFDSVLFTDGAKWHSNLIRLSAYLQRLIVTGNAEELSAASVTACPHVSDLTWLKVTEIARWFDNARVPIQRLLARRKASVAPSLAWWLDLKTVLVVGSMAMKTRSGLQAGYATLLSLQPQRISMLRLALAGEVGVEGPLPAFQRAALRDQNRSGQMIGSQDGMFAVRPHAVVAFLRGMSSWAAELFDGLSAQERQKLIVDAADRLLELVLRLHTVAEELEERGSSNNTSLSSFPPVLPDQVAGLHPVDFQEVVRMYRPRLIETYSDAKLAAIESQHQELRTAASSEAAVQQFLALNAENPAASFSERWEPLRDRWNLLADFCGGLATVFPTPNDKKPVAMATSTATWSHRTFSDFALEARLQCQQFATLQALEGRNTCR
ncbi:hypothetical protein V7S43_006121 [Phytophthora oleae]|uniref:Uncharacterized protein n=1 Tax=Phytophthora oleae TaxID=2107226 RepID=A0ABD3FPZ7_9STRA